MSKIYELILELCPNGVEYKNIKDLCFENFWVMPSTPNYQNEGIPYITSKNIRNGIVMFDDVKYITEEDYKTISNNRPITENDFLISMIGTIGEVGIVRKEDLPFYGQNMYLLRLNTNLINIKYFYHYFTSEMVRKKLLGAKNNGNQGYLKTKNIESLKVPVPPLEVQEEIVRILDKFGELEAELEAELEVRKSQYEFWRGKLLNQENEIKKLSELSDVIDSLHATPQYVENGYPMIRVADVKGGIVNTTDALRVDAETYKKFISKYKPQKGDIIISRVGSFGNVCIVGNEDICLGQNTSIIHPKIDSKYLYYYLSSDIVQDWIKNNVNGAGYKSLSLANINEIPVAVPSVEEQQRVSNILDKFDKLVNDISIGLPAEIELRRKQYEYYRNKLLSFEEINHDEY